jgi:hypothetical protein
VRLQIVPNSSSIRFRYLEFSMADVGSISMSMVNLYNHFPRRCTIIFSFHENKLYGVRMNSFGNSIFSVVFNLRYLQKESGVYFS